MLLIRMENLLKSPEVVTKNNSSNIEILKLIGLYNQFEILGLKSLGYENKKQYFQLL